MMTEKIRNNAALLTKEWTDSVFGWIAGEATRP